MGPGRQAIDRGGNGAPQLLERNLDRSSFAAFALNNAPARFSHTPTPALVAMKRTKKSMGAADTRVTAELPAASASDLRLGAMVCLKSRPDVSGLSGEEKDNAMVVLELSHSRTVRRPLLVLLPDGTFNSFEHDARVRLMHAALVSGEDVTIAHEALQQAGVQAERQESALARGKFCEYSVTVNGKQVDMGSNLREDAIHEQLLLQQRRGQPDIAVFARVSVPAPTPSDPNLKRQAHVPLATVRAMSDIHRQRFKQAVVKVFGQGVSTWTRAQVKMQQIQRLRSLLRAVNEGDVHALTDALDKGADANALSSDGTSLLGAVCRCGGEAGEEMIGVLVAAGADVNLAEGLREVLRPTQASAAKRHDTSWRTRPREQAMLEVWIRASAVHTAAATGNASALQALLRYGAHLNKRDAPLSPLDPAHVGRAVHTETDKEAGRRREEGADVRIKWGGSMAVLREQHTRGAHTGGGLGGADDLLHEEEEVEEKGMAAVYKSSLGRSLGLTAFHLACAVRIPPSLPPSPSPRHPPPHSLSATLPLSRCLCLSAHACVRACGFSSRLSSRPAWVQWLIISALVPCAFASTQSSPMVLWPRVLHRTSSLLGVYFASLHPRGVEAHTRTYAHTYWHVQGGHVECIQVLMAAGARDVDKPEDVEARPHGRHGRQGRQWGGERREWVAAVRDGLGRTGVMSLSLCFDISALTSLPVLAFIPFLPPSPPCSLSPSSPRPARWADGCQGW
jgi:hypothetical protein